MQDNRQVFCGDCGEAVTDREGARVAVCVDCRSRFLDEMIGRMAAQIDLVDGFTIETVEADGMVTVTVRDATDAVVMTGMEKHWQRFRRVLNKALRNGGQHDGSRQVH